MFNVDAFKVLMDMNPLFANEPHLELSTRYCKLPNSGVRGYADVHNHENALEFAGMLNMSYFSLQGGVSL